MANILIIEDDVTFAKLLSMHLEDQGHLPRVVGSAAAARNLLAQDNIDAVLLDYQLPDVNGMELLKEIKICQAPPPVIMITGTSNTGLAIESIQAGAYDFIRKPLDHAELDATLSNALTAYRLSSKMKAVVEAHVAPVSVDSLVGHSRAMVEVCKTIGKVANTDATVLITGESGTGKEVVARAIHHHSGHQGPFLPVNCSAIVETLLESELFGHEKGAFTGAVARKEGRFEVAQDGTLFLDEIGEMAPGLQAKLLRVLQERRFERVGGTQTLTTSARIIAATHRDLSAMIQERTFREDLYYRLNVVTIHLPPLRERLQDLPLLVEHLLSQINHELHKNVTRISEPAWAKLKEYLWPGNIRELQNVLTRAVVLARGNVLTPDLLGLSLPQGQPNSPATSAADEELELITLDELEARHVQKILHHTRWHKGHACEILGISRPALERKINKYSIR